MKNVDTFQDNTEDNTINTAFSMSIVQTIDSLTNKGTIKYLMKLSDGNFIECVLLAYSKNIFLHKKLVSLCISCQVGCRLDCSFCATGKDKFVRDMTSKEIIDQLLVVQDHLKRKGSKVKITGITFMGMGEPLLNYDNVVDAIKFFNKEGNHGDSLHISLSTSGIIPKIYKLTEEKLNLYLYLSLHATTEDQRKKLMPKSISNIPDLIKSMEHYSKQTNTAVCINYLLFDGVNDTPEDAERLALMIGSKKFNVSLKMYCDNNFPGLKSSSIETAEKFMKILKKKNISVGILNSFGNDIYSGCGQLRQRKMLDKSDMKHISVFSPKKILRSTKEMLSTTYHIIKNRK
jgi:23S rRNA (adenine2503-C2)-methyltransferase